MSAQKGKAYCRLCAEGNSEDKMIDLKMDIDKKAEISNKLFRINTYPDFDNESFPTTVCIMCLNTLEKAFDFVTTVEKAQSVLRDIFIVQQIKTEAPQLDSDSNDANSQDNHALVKQESISNVKIELPKENSLEQTEVPKKPQKLANKSPKVQKKSQNTLKKSAKTVPLQQTLSWESYGWTCSYCETQFPSAEELIKHSIQYHESCNAFRCTDCTYRKLRLDSFLIHVRRHKPSLKLSCHKCFKPFTSGRARNIHKLGHLTTAHVCPGCNTCFESHEELRKHADAYYKLTTKVVECNMTCDKCGKVFANKQNLAEHLVIHSGVRAFQCEICKRSFKRRTQLRSHIGVHDTHKPYSCDQCGRSFRLQNQLTSHSIIHTDLMPFPCSYCDKRFRFRGLLNQHIRQHTGVKPYSCQQCYREFTNWPNYNKHMKARHNMNMAKKKHTPEGFYPINPETGTPIMHPETNKILEWKKQVMALRRRPGRHRTQKVDENNIIYTEVPIVDEKNNMNDTEDAVKTNETIIQYKQE